MIVDNFELIKLLLSFENPDEFYFLSILKRKKEHPELGSNSEVIKHFYIGSFGSLEHNKETIITLCKLHNARAYINLNKRSYEHIAFHSLKKISDCIMNKDYKAVRNAYDSVCGSYSTGDKLWVVDVDDLNFDKVLEIAEHINYCHSEFDPNVKAFIPTINGWHIITHPFNVKQIEPFRLENPFDLQKNNPTLLYYNSELLKY